MGRGAAMTSDFYGVAGRLIDGSPMLQAFVASGAVTRREAVQEIGDALARERVQAEAAAGRICPVTQEDTPHVR